MGQFLKEGEIGKKIGIFSFLAVQDSSIGDLVTHSLSHLLISEHFRAVVDNVTMTMTMTLVDTGRH